MHADTALAAVTEQLEGMKVADERRVEVLTRRQEWREELTAQQVVVSLATRMQAAARGLLTRAALRRINTLVSPVRGKMSGLYLNRVYGDRPVYWCNGWVVGLEGRSTLSLCSERALNLAPARSRAQT